jgi:cytoskeleton protein RodZ
MIEEEEQQAVIQGPGQILRQARERADLSCQDIADKIKLKKSLIEDIEQDNYDTNISLTYVRGYLKLYAKHVKVAESEVLSAFEKISTQKKAPAQLQSFSRKVAIQANDDKLMLVTYLIAAAIIALGIIWWVQQSPTGPTTSDVGNSLEVAKEILAIDETLTADPDILMTELEPEPSISTNMNQDGNVLSSESADSPLDEKLIETIEEPNVDYPSINEEAVEDTIILSEQSDVLGKSVTELATPVELIFEFSGDCWMNLSDATGENIAYGVKVKGRVMPVTGIPPFVVTLGAPEVVKIRYAGESIDMSLLPSGQIANFDLPLSE